MSKPKYKQGKQIKSIAEFEKCDNTWFKWNGRTRHRAMLESLQYHTLDLTIKGGRLYRAERIEEGSE